MEPILPKGLIPPQPATLEKYGLTLEEWITHVVVDAEGYAICPICEKRQERLVTDHKHAPGWKRMAPEDRRVYVRGCVCRGCNYYVLERHGTILKHRNAADYLERWERRFAEWQARLSASSQTTK